MTLGKNKNGGVYEVCQNQHGEWLMILTYEPDVIGTIFGPFATEDEAIQACIADGMETEDNTVYLSYDYGFEETIHPLAIGVSSAAAHSIYRHYNRIINRKRLWSDCRQTGLSVGVVSRVWCTNHADFEKQTEDLLGYVR